MCGRRKLLGRFDRARGRFTLRCPTCCRCHTDPFLHSEETGLLRGVKGYKPALSRLMVWADGYQRPALARGAAACTRCGRSARLRMGMPEDAPQNVRARRGVHVRCDRCGPTYWTALTGLARDLPEARRFWREHPRMRTLPEREVEAAGSPALVVGFESVADGARLDVLVVRDTFEVIGARRNPS
jgi:hypothetical protein